MKLKTSFQTELDYEVKPDGWSYLVKPLRFFSHRFNRTWEAGKGFPTDRASAEFMGFKLIGKSERPWVGHDFLFATGDVGLFGAGIVLYDMLRVEGNGWFPSLIFSAFATIHPKAVKSYLAHRKEKTLAVKFLKGLSQVQHEQPRQALPSNQDGQTSK